MTKLIITDTHFGVKQNSITWLESQKAFIEKQIIPHIRMMHEPIQILHLGDVFDSRSSISTYIATEVVNIFKKLSALPNVDHITIIAGNHDFYSPNSDRIDTPHLILKNIPKVHIISNLIEEDENSLYVPWYEWENEAYKSRLDKHIKYIFTHADIVTDKISIPGCKIFTGHMHIPYIDKNKGIYNLGSCYALNFGDSNQKRGYYILKDDGDLRFSENTQSIRFWRFRGEELYNISHTNIHAKDYIEVYADQQLLAREDYAAEINKFSSIYKNLSIIPLFADLTNESVCIDYNISDIEDIAKTYIPENLMDKFEIILNRTKELG